MAGTGSRVPVWARGLLMAGWLGVALAGTAPGRAEAVEIGGPFALVDQNGIARTDGDFRGDYLLVYFGYTHCPDLCPTTLDKLSQALDALATVAAAKADRIVPVLISVDPERDTPEVLEGYAALFHPRLVALTGTRRALGKVSRAYGAFHAKVPTGRSDDYVVDHTSFVYLMGPDGKYILHLEKDADVDDVVDALQRHVVVPAGTN